MADVELDQAAERTQAGKDAGDNYTAELETIRDNLDAADGSGTTLGKTVEAQIKMTEAETTFQIQSGIPSKVSSAVKDAAKKVAQ